MVDGPAGLSEVTRTIFFLADPAILPCGPSVLDLRAVIDAVGRKAEIKISREGAPRAQRRELGIYLCDLCDLLRLIMEAKLGGLQNRDRR